MRSPSYRKPADIRDPSPRRTGYSMTPEAVRARTKRLLDDGWSDEIDRRTKLYRGRITARRLRDKAHLKAHRTNSMPWEPSPKLQARIRHHLARGRDVGDIAVREGIMVSLVAQALAQMGGCNVSGPAHSQAATR